MSHELLTYMLIDVSQVDDFHFPEPNSFHFHDFQDSWKFRGPLETIILDSGAQKAVIWIDPISPITQVKFQYCANNFRQLLVDDFGESLDTTSRFSSCVGLCLAFGTHKLRLCLWRLAQVLFQNQGLSLLFIVVLCLLSFVNKVSTVSHG